MVEILSLISPRPPSSITHFMNVPFRLKRKTDFQKSNWEDRNNLDLLLIRNFPLSTINCTWICYSGKFILAYVNSFEH